MKFLESPFACYVLDSNQSVIAYKNYDKRLFFDREMVIGTLFMDIIDVQKSDDSQAVVDAVCKAIKYNCSICQQYTSFYGDGLSVSVGLLGKWDEDGNLHIYLNPLGELAKMINIESESDVSSLITSEETCEQLNVDIYIFDKNGAPIVINNSLINLGVGNKEDVIGVNLFNLPYLSDVHKHKLLKNIDVQFYVELDSNKLDVYDKTRHTGVSNCRVTITIIYDGIGNIHRYILVISDNSDLISTVEKNQNLLHSQEHVVKPIMDNINAGVYFYDNTGLCKDVNDIALGYFDFPKDQFVGNLNLFNVNHIPEDSKNILRNGGSISYQVSHTDVINSIYNNYNNSTVLSVEKDTLFSVNCSPIFSNNKEFVGYISVYNDITEIRQSRKDIEKLNAKVALALDAGELTVWTYDFSTNNYTVLGIDQFSAIHTAKVEFVNFVFHKNREVIATAYEAILTRRSQKETFILRAVIDGKLVVFRSTIIPREAEGEVLHVIGVSKDISEEERIKSDLEDANTMLDKQNSELNLSNQLFKEIMKQLPGLFFIKDISDDYRFYIVNSQFCDIVAGNKPMSQVIGSSDYDFFPKEDADDFRATDLICIEENRSLETDEKLIINGCTRTWRTVKTPITLSNDKKMLMCLSFEITEIINLNESLNNMYNEGQVILGALPVGVAIYDKNGKREYGNNAVAQMLGVYDMKLHVDNPVNLFEDYPLYFDLLAKFKEGENFDRIVEYDLQNAKDANFIDTEHSHKIYIEIKARCIRDHNGSIIKYGLIVNDITKEHIHALEKEYSRKMIAFTIDNAEMALMEYDVIKHEIFAYRNSISGLTLERSLCVDTFFKHLDAEESSEIEFRKMISEMDEGLDKTLSIDIRIKKRTATGYEWMYCSIENSPFERDENGRIIKYAGCMKNNTEWILLNNTHIELNTQLKSVLNIGNLLPFVCEVKGNKFNLSTPNERKSILSDILEEVFEFDQLLSLLYLKDRDVVQTTLRNMLSGDLSKVMLEVRFDVEGLRDKIFELDMSVVPNEEFGVDLKLIGYMHDITERQQMISDLREAKEEAEKSVKLKSAFLANMSHEIRTPLNAIIGFSELLVDADDAATKAEYLSIIATNNELLLKLINDILDLSKIESGFAEINPSELDFSQFFNEMYMLMQQRATNPDVKLSAINPYSRCIVNMDKNRLTQVCLNYITNAIKYTDEGSIEMGYELINNGIRIYVKDTGIGIADWKQYKVFQRFAKLDDFAPGIGLGMPITKAITEAMGGEVGFESEEGVGSTFWSWIPCDSILTDV